jgi:hypothetical protein
MGIHKIVIWHKNESNLLKVLSWFSMIFIQSKYYSHGLCGDKDHGVAGLNVLKPSVATAAPDRGRPWHEVKHKNAF